MQLAYSRLPDETEVALTIQFIKDQVVVFAEQPAYQPDRDKSPVRTAQQEATALMCQMLLNSNEFLYAN